MDLLIGNPAKAKRQLGWEAKVRFKELVEIMVDYDLELAKREAQIAALPAVAESSAAKARVSRPAKNDVSRSPQGLSA